MEKLNSIDNSITSFIPFYDYICNKCKKGYYNMLLYRHLGDTFVMAGLKEEFEKVHSGKLHYLVKPSQEVILKQFGITEYTVVDLDHLLKERIKYSNRSRLDVDLLEEELYVKMFTSLPIKDVPFLGSHIRYVREVLKWDNFVNAWAKMFGLDTHMIDIPYCIPKMSENLKSQLKRLPPVDKIILLAPELQSFGWVPEDYWHSIVMKYKEEGYTIVTNCLDPRSCIRDTVNLDMSVSDLIALGMRCCQVHSIRSGLCDLLAAKEDNLYVYYTEEMIHAYSANYFSLNECYNLKNPVHEIMIPEDKKSFRLKAKNEMVSEMRKLYGYLKKYKVIRGLNRMRYKILNFFRSMKRTGHILKKALKRIHLSTFHPRTLENIMYAMDRWRDPLDMRISQLGEENPNKLIYLVHLPEWWVPTAGFFALLNKTLCAISFADRMGLEIVVDNWNGCAYEVDPSITGTSIVFEYYFEPLSDLKYQSVMKSKNVCFSEPQNVDLVFRENGMDNWFLPTETYLERLAKLYEKYIRLNSDIQKKIDSDISSLLHEKRTLGVHYRGTDYSLNCNGHPISVSIEDYIAEIKKAMEKEKFEQIFLATDDLAAIERFKKEFEHIVFYNDTYRTEGRVSVAYINDNKKPNGYILGYQVLRDAYTLAEGEGLIGGKSQVCYGTQIIKKAKNHKFKYVRIIDKGINENTMDWIDVYKKM